MRERFQWDGIKAGKDTATVRSRAWRSLELNAQLQRVLDASPEPSDPRAAMALASADLGIEHHRAIAKLSKSGDAAAAAAMLRVLLDSGLHATYILHAMSVERAAALRAGSRLYVKDADYYLPLTKAIFKALGDIPTIGTHLTSFYEKQIHAFHKLTHGDAPQLVRRRTSAPAYDPQEVCDFLELSDLLVLAASYVGAQALQHDEMKRAVIGLRNAIGFSFLFRNGQQFDAQMANEVPPDPAWQRHK